MRALGLLSVHNENLKVKKIKPQPSTFSRSTIYIYIGYIYISFQFYHDTSVVFSLSMDEKTVHVGRSEIDQAEGSS